MAKKIFVALYLLYALFFIYNTSVVVQGQRYFLLADDAVISMQYAKNMATGHGLKWSLDSKVEGITNPLWTLYMSIPHFLNIPLSKTALFIQFTALLFMLLTLKYVWNISKSMTAVFFTAFFYRMNYWFYSGLEVSILTFLTVFVVYLVLKEDNPVKIYFICGLMTLIRIDMALFFTATILIYKKDWIKGLVILIIFMGAQTLARYLYFGDLLPNTYYLKMYGYELHHRLFRGIITFFNNLYFMNWIPFVAIIPFIKSKEQKVMFTYICIPILYSFYIGGDAWEAAGGTNRFVTAVIPLFFILFAGSFYRIMELLQIKNKIVIYILLSAIFINMNSLTGPKSLKNLISPGAEVKASANTLNIALYLKNNFNDDVTIAGQGAGVLPYFSEKKYFIDLLGKNDSNIAKMKVSVIKTWWDALTKAPGHMKYDQQYSIADKKPDIIVHNVLDGVIDRYLKENYIESKQQGFSFVWFKKGLKTINNTLPE
ncbi:MAG: hypothetical protein JXR81_08470 [Candidatus Goldbacteria bacterium]|nr:hypothetical protein [Candidatus Goldiibacteriota bacterium]